MSSILFETVSMRAGLCRSGPTLAIAGRASSASSGLQREKAARAAFVQLCPGCSVIVAGVPGIVLPIAGPATAVVGSGIAMGEPADVFQAAHVIVVTEPVEAAGGGGGDLSGADERRDGDERGDGGKSKLVHGRRLFQLRLPVAAP